jgi:hypothetical protein
MRYHARLVNPIKTPDRPQERWGKEIGPLQVWGRATVEQWGGEVEILELTWAVVDVIVPKSEKV